MRSPTAAASSNGVIEPPEVCDDHNTTPDDGCSADCLEARRDTSVFTDLDGKPAITCVGKDVFVVRRTSAAGLMLAEVAFSGP